MSYLINEDDITKVIPQRPPFIMVNNLVTHDNLGASSNFYVKEDNILVKDRKFTEMGLLENIAQTAAANVGYICTLKKIPVPLGFIGAISKVKLIKLPSVQSMINTRIQIKHEIFNITLIEGLVTQNGETMISCEMKIMVDNNEAK